MVEHEPTVVHARTTPLLLDVRPANSLGHDKLPRKRWTVEQINPTLRRVEADATETKRLLRRTKGATTEADAPLR